MQSDQDLLQRVVECNREYVKAADAFLQEARIPVEVLRQGLHGSVIETLTALGLLSRLPEGERIQLLGDLIQLCVSPKFASLAQATVLALPREWLLANLEVIVEPLLQYCDHLDYSMLLGLYDKIDHNLAVQLARRAAENSDYDIKEVGESYILHAAKLASHKDLAG